MLHHLLLGNKCPAALASVRLAVGLAANDVAASLGMHDDKGRTEPRLLEAHLFLTDAVTSANAAAAAASGHARSRRL